MVSDSELKKRFQQICVKEGRYMGLIFRTPGEPKAEFGTTRIIGRNDSLDDALAIAKDIGQECVAVAELDKRQSVWLNAKRGNRMAIIEGLIHKIASAGIQSQAA